MIQALVVLGPAAMGCEEAPQVLPATTLDHTQLGSLRCQEKLAEFNAACAHRKADPTSQCQAIAKAVSETCGRSHSGGKQSPPLCECDDGVAHRAAVVSLQCMCARFGCQDLRETQADWCSNARARQGTIQAKLGCGSLVVTRRQGGVESAVVFDSERGTVVGRGRWAAAPAPPCNTQRHEGGLQPHCDQWDTVDFCSHRVAPARGRATTFRGTRQTLPE